MNNKLKWLFSSSMALYPSVYIYDQQSWNKAFTYGRLEEAIRLATWVSKENKRTVPVFPYFRHLYEGKPFEFDYLTLVRNCSFLHLYLLLTQLEVCTISYRQSFSTRIYDPGVKAWLINPNREKPGTVTYSRPRCEGKGNKS